MCLFHFCQNFQPEANFLNCCSMLLQIIASLVTKSNCYQRFEIQFGHISDNIVVHSKQEIVMLLLVKYSKKRLLDL